MADSFVSTLKAESVSRLKLPTRQAARTAIFGYLEIFYNTRRLHSSLATELPPTLRRLILPTPNNPTFEGKTLP